MSDRLLRLLNRYNDARSIDAFLKARADRPTLVYIHIPKTAGSSFRHMLARKFDPARIYWHGIDSFDEFQTQITQSVTDGLVFGGHRRIAFYPAGSGGTVFCATIREPVARAVSLFSYYARPDAADNDTSRKEREARNAVWLEKGLQARSIVATIRDCREFREQIANSQCRHLSRYDPTFDGVKRTLARENFVIGQTERFECFIGELTTLFHWQAAPEVRVNSSKSRINQSILAEEGAENCIRSLCAEDIALFNYVTEKHEGLWSNIHHAEFETQFATAFQAPGSGHSAASRS